MKDLNKKKMDLDLESRSVKELEQKIAQLEAKKKQAINPIVVKNYDAAIQKIKKILENKKPDNTAEIESLKQTLNDLNELISISGLTDEIETAIAETNARLLELTGDKKYALEKKDFTKSDILEQLAEIRKQKEKIIEEIEKLRQKESVKKVKILEEPEEEEEEEELREEEKELFQRYLETLKKFQQDPNNKKLLEELTKIESDKNLLPKWQKFPISKDTKNLKRRISRVAKIIRLGYRRASVLEEEEDEIEKPREEPDEVGDNEKYLAALLEFEKNPSNENRKMIQAIETNFKILYAWKTNPIYMENPTSLRFKRRIKKVSERLGKKIERKKKEKKTKTVTNPYEILDTLREFEKLLVEYRKERFEKNVPKENFDKEIIQNTFAKIKKFQSRFSKRYFQLSFEDMNDYAKINNKLKKVRAQIRKLDLGEMNIDEQVRRIKKHLEKVNYDSDRQFEKTMEDFYANFVQENLNIWELILDELVIIMENLKKDPKDEKKLDIVVRYYNSIIDLTGADEDDNEEEEENLDENTSEYDYDDPLIDDEDRQVVQEVYENLETELGFEQAQSSEYFLLFLNYRAKKIQMTPEIKLDLENEEKRLDELIKTTEDSEVLQVAINAKSNIKLFLELVEYREKEKEKNDEENDSEAEVDNFDFKEEESESSQNEENDAPIKKRKPVEPQPQVPRPPPPFPLKRLKPKSVVLDTKPPEKDDDFIECRICQAPANYMCCDNLFYCSQSCQRQDTQFA